MSNIHIIGGGTFAHVRSHLALAAPAFGGTARKLTKLFRSENAEVRCHLTKMADPLSDLVTNDDVEALLVRLIADKDTRCIILNAALCDYQGYVLDENEVGLLNWDGRTRSGSHETRLKTSDGYQTLRLEAANKLIGRIRKERKDIFVVGFKTTTGASSDEQYRIALDMLKRDSLNLVLANDTVTRNNMIVAPEETRYSETTDRDTVLQMLVKMVLSRIQNTFTRSTVVEGESVPWTSELIPANLREVVDHCIARGAYKKFRGVTAGHFAVKIDNKTVLTSIRKTDHNMLAQNGLVKVEYDGLHKVLAHGAKPSVGGQSQRIIFDEHPDLDCIVHAHIPMRPDARDKHLVSMDAGQWSRECGSHDCGKSVSNLLPIRGEIRAVMIDNHGPNIVFDKTVPASQVIDFIEANFDLTRKTGGMI